jgi:hypothetical protein
LGFLDQDEHLDILTEAIQRQKEIGNLINQELDTHLQILEETDEHVELTRARLQNTHTRLDRFREESGQGRRNLGVIFVLILVLFLVIWLAKRT